MFGDDCVVYAIEELNFLSEKPKIRQIFRNRA